MSVLTLIATWLTMLLGIGVIIIGLYYVWDYVFRLILAFFRIHELFRKFMYEYYREKHRRPSNDKRGDSD